jgi:hypothetical protein
VLLGWKEGTAQGLSCPLCPEQVCAYGGREWGTHDMKIFGFHLCTCESFEIKSRILCAHFSGEKCAFFWDFEILKACYVSKEG